MMVLKWLGNIIIVIITTIVIIVILSSGSVIFQFNNKGIFKPNKTLDDDTMDAILTKAIDHNINIDFENDNDDINITTDPDTLDTLSDIMDELGINIHNA